jgi:carbonic anhydrase/acetyltransferase-like protein (isoleucine patch superfamily)
MDTQARLDYYLSQTPSVHRSAYIAESAVLIGAITVGEQSSIWPQCVLRGDINTIRIGRGTNIQDNAVIHLSDDYGVELKDYITIGHGAILHACHIEDECLIGMRATIMDGAIVGKQSLIGAHSLVTAGTVIPEGSLVMGTPAKVVRTLSMHEREQLRSWADKYILVAAAHKAKQLN